MFEEKPSYYAIIPADVRYSDITPNAKLLYGEITALANKTGICYAKNEYFANLYNVTTVSISKWIKELLKNGFIKTSFEYKEGTKEILYRYITILNGGIKEKLNTPLKEKFKDNNTREINNTSINKLSGLSIFIVPTIEEIEAFIKEKNYCINAQYFYDYYTANGWKVGRNKMKDWKATVRMWNSRQNKKEEEKEEENKKSYNYGF